MSTYPADSEDEREEKLRQNTSFDTDAKSEDDVDPMHSDSWSGGSVVPDAKKVARGEAPANRSERGEGLPAPAEFDDSTDVTRPWAPTHPEAEGAETDAAGRERLPFDGEEPRNAPPTHSPQDGEPQGDRPKVTKPGAFKG